MFKWFNCINTRKTQKSFTWCQIRTRDLQLNFCRFVNIPNFTFQLLIPLFNKKHVGIFIDLKVKTPRANVFLKNLHLYLNQKWAIFGQSKSLPFLDFLCFFFSFPVICILDHAFLSEAKKTHGILSVLFNSYSTTTFIRTVKSILSVVSFITLKQRSHTDISRTANMICAVHVG